jgi:dihydroxyacetone kinase phosphoprotein-dependent L subunit
MQPVTQAQVEIALRSIARTALDNEQYFCDLDGLAGDGDFGTSLATGFREVEAQWESLDRQSIGHLFLAISQIITAKVGGCSGPIWGTAFMRAGIVARDKTSLTHTDINAIFERAIDGIRARGGASEGDKTLLDALAPMARAFSACAEDGDPLAACLSAAETAKETTKSWEARRGRQSFAGARSVGTYDPGTVAIALMTRNIQAALMQEKIA